MQQESVVEDFLEMPMDFEAPSLFIADICDFCPCRQKNTNLHPISHTFSIPPYNSTQFPNLLFILININGLIHNHLSLINPQKYLEQVPFIVLPAFLKHFKQEKEQIPTATLNSFFKKGPPLHNKQLPRGQKVTCPV